MRAGASGLRVLPGCEINLTWGVSSDTLFPPTEAGWAEFMGRATESGLGLYEPGRAGPGGKPLVEDADAARVRRKIDSEDGSSDSRSGFG